MDGFARSVWLESLWGSGFHDSMSGVGLGLAVRPHAKNSLVHTETTQRIGRHGVRYRGRW